MVAIRRKMIAAGLNRLQKTVEQVSPSKPKVRTERPEGPSVVHMGESIEDILFGQLLHITRRGKGGLERARVPLRNPIQDAGEVERIPGTVNGTRWVRNGYWTVCPKCEGRGAAHFEENFDSPYRDAAGKAICVECQDHRIPGTDVAGVVFPKGFSPEALFERYNAWFEGNMRLVQGAIVSGDKAAATHLLKGMNRVITYQCNFFWRAPNERHGKATWTQLLAFWKGAECAFLSLEEEVETEGGKQTVLVFLHQWNSFRKLIKSFTRKEERPVAEAIPLGYESDVETELDDDERAEWEAFLCGVTVVDESLEEILAEQRIDSPRDELCDVYFG